MNRETILRNTSAPQQRALTGLTGPFSHGMLSHESMRLISMDLEPTVLRSPAQLLPHVTLSAHPRGTGF